MEKVSKINVFRGREHGAKSKNQILTGSKGVDTKISAPFSCSPRRRHKTLRRFFMPTFCCLLKTVSKRVENPLFLPLCATNRKGHGVFPCGGCGRDTDGGNTEKQHFSHYEEGCIRQGSFPYRKIP